MLLNDADHCTLEKHEGGRAKDVQEDANGQVSPKLLIVPIIFRANDQHGPIIYCLEKTEITVTFVVLLYLLLTWLLTAGMAKSRRLEAPLRKVKEAMNNRKFPNLSAKKPANGGPKMSAPGITELTSEASSIVNPRDLRWMVCNMSRWFYYSH